MSTTALRQRLAELDAEIAETEKVLNYLRQDRAAVQHQLDATTFPVLALPRARRNHGQDIFSLPSFGQGDPRHKLTPGYHSEAGISGTDNLSRSLSLMESHRPRHPCSLGDVLPPP